MVVSKTVSVHFVAAPNSFKREYRTQNLKRHSIAFKDRKTVGRNVFNQVQLQMRRSHMSSIPRKADSSHTMDLFAAIVRPGRQSPELFQSILRRLQAGDAFEESLTYSQLLCIEGALEELREDECCAVDAALLEAEMKHLRCELH